MRHLNLLIGASLLIAAHSAQAGRPLQTEDAGVLDAGACELEGATARLKRNGLASTDSYLQLGCGVGHSSQIALAVSRARASGEHASGLALLGKTELFQATGEQPTTVTLAWIVDGTKLAGDSLRHTGTEIKLVSTTPVAADYALHANLGHARDEQAHARATTWNLAVEHAGLGADKRLAPMAEIFGDDHAAPWWNVALRFVAVPDKAYVDASYGRQIAGGRARLVTLGFKLAF